jgi:hypothetical protein
MRVNHAGEVSAQALYQGQALTARNNEVREKLEQAALEENDHLAWTESRLHELGDRTSYLNPIWYTGSLAIGAFAGALGDKWSLGFLAETEHTYPPLRHTSLHRYDGMKYFSNRLVFFQHSAFVGKGLPTYELLLNAHRNDGALPFESVSIPPPSSYRHTKSSGTI